MDQGPLRSPLSAAPVAPAPSAPPLPVAPQAKHPPEEARPQIRVTEQRVIQITGKPEEWKRQPTVNGTGATHVKSFHCKLTGDCLEYMDRQINDWLDSHPGCEVKHATSAIGEWMGKQMKEPALIVQLWV